MVLNALKLIIFSLSKMLAKGGIIKFHDFFLGINEKLIALIFNLMKIGLLNICCNYVTMFCNSKLFL